MQGAIKAAVAGQVAGGIELHPPLEAKGRNKAKKPEGMVQNMEGPWENDKPVPDTDLRDDKVSNVLFISLYHSDFFAGL